MKKNWKLSLRRCSSHKKRVWKELNNQIRWTTVPTLIRKQTCAAYARDEGIHPLVCWVFCFFLNIISLMKLIWEAGKKTSFSKPSERPHQTNSSRGRGWERREQREQRGAGRRVVCSAPSLFVSLFSILDLFLKEHDGKPSEEVFLRGDERKSIVKKTLQSLYLMSYLKYIFWFTWHVTWHSVIISFDAFCTRWHFYDFCSVLCLYECSVCNFLS